MVIVFIYVQVIHLIKTCLLTDVCVLISLDDAVYTLQYVESYTGKVFMISDDKPY